MGEMLFLLVTQLFNFLFAESSESAFWGAQTIWPASAVRHADADQQLLIFT